MFVPWPGMSTTVSRGIESRALAPPPTRSSMIESDRLGPPTLRAGLGVAPGAGVGAEHEDRVRRRQREAAAVELRAGRRRRPWPLDLRRRPGTGPARASSHAADARSAEVARPTRPTGEAAARRAAARGRDAARDPAARARRSGSRSSPSPLVLRADGSRGRRAVDACSRGFSSAMGEWVSWPGVARATLRHRRRPRRHQAPGRRGRRRPGASTTDPPPGLRPRPGRPLRDGRRRGRGGRTPWTATIAAVGFGIPCTFDRRTGHGGAGGQPAARRPAASTR